MYNQKKTLKLPYDISGGVDGKASWDSVIEYDVKYIASFDVVVTNQWRVCKETRSTVRGDQPLAGGWLVNFIVTKPNLPTPPPPLTPTINIDQSLPVKTQFLMIHGQ